MKILPSGIKADQENHYAADLYIRTLSQLEIAEIETAIKVSPSGE